MDYLVELYNKHIEENTGQKYYLNERNVKDRLDSLLILRYFIKWLVENDKIDLEKVKINWLNYVNDEILENKILMLLSISDTPIEDLILYLK